uniref:Lipoprotein n=1 Tax=Escherichia phage PMBT16 TaxID=3137282 RepID=A0AAU8BVB6_9VIRU
MSGQPRTVHSTGSTFFGVGCSRISKGKILNR